MASITIHAVTGTSTSSSGITGSEQLLVTNKDGQTSTLTIN
jgi:hypothetical protein